MQILVVAAGRTPPRGFLALLAHLPVGVRAQLADLSAIRAPWTTGADLLVAPLGRSGLRVDEVAALSAAADPPVPWAGAVGQDEAEEIRAGLAAGAVDCLDPRDREAWVLMTDRLARERQARRQRRRIDQALVAVREGGRRCVAQADEAPILLDLLAEALAFDRVFVVGVSPDQDVVESLQARTDGRVADPVSYPLPTSPCRAVLARAEPVVHVDRIGDRFPAWAPGLGSAGGYAAAPLRDHAGEIVGLVAGVSREELWDPPATARLMRCAADRLGACLWDEGFELGEPGAILWDGPVPDRPLLDLVGDALIVLDQQGRILRWNAGARTLYGWEASEVLGVEVADLGLFTVPEDWARARGELRRLGAWAGELELRTRGGRRVFVHSRWTELPAEEEGVRPLLMLAFDITARRLAEEQRDATRRLDSVARFAEGITLELNNALSPLMLSVDLLRSPMDENRRQELLAALDGSLQQGAELIRRVFWFARGLETAADLVDLPAIVEARGVAWSDGLPPGVELECKVERDEWWVRGDGGRLSSLVDELVRNSVESLSTGGRITLALAPIFLDRRAVARHPDAAPGPYLVLTVADTGCGMAAEVQEQMLEPFFSTKGGQGRRGLGLASAHATLSAHGGFLEVDSAPEQGTALRVFFPAVRPGSGEEAAPDPVPAGSVALEERPREAILVVDDDPAFRRTVAETLHSIGYRVLEAQDGTEAVALLMEHRHLIDGVVTDLVMPDLDGIGLMRIARQLEPSLKVIVCSGRVDFRETLARSEEVPDAVLSKPFAAEELLATVGSVLDSSDGPASDSPHPVPSH